MKSIHKSYLVLSLIVIVFILLCIFSFWIPEYLVDIFKDDFGQETGPIGDTIGGTVTPYIAIITAILALLAFGCQFISMQQQQKDLKVERLESRFYNMLDVYQSNTERLDAGGIKGKDAAEELAGEYNFIYTLLYSIYQSQIKDYIESETIDKVSLGKINLFIDSLNKSKIQKAEFLTRLSYGLFYYGYSYTYPYSQQSAEIFLFTEILKEKLQKVAFTQDNSSLYSKWLKEEKALCDIDSYKAPYPICQGHNDKLGCYYRQMFQIVKMISLADKDLLDEKSKYEHIRILRSQMSDYEQMLLFYNSISDFGLQWNKSCESIEKESDMGLIPRFRMIKHIPANVCWRGIFPVDYYKKECRYWESKNIVFFERPQMLQVEE